jgi:hypothetical protein
MTESGCSAIETSLMLDGALVLDGALMLDA